jgi:tetratricopeptide (TPR) repeat protein
LGRSRCIRQIGAVYSERLKEALRRDEPDAIALELAQTAEKHFLEAIQLCPKEALNDLSAIHNNLGSLYFSIGDWKSAREHSESSAELEERMGNRFAAGQSRFNLALTYFYSAKNEDVPSQKRQALERSRAYAEAALRDFEYYGGRATSNEFSVKTLIETINQTLSELLLH